MNTRLIEEISLNAHPALNTYFYDGWYLRFADGYTNRANSVNMLCPSTLPLDEKIKYCEKVYESQDLPTVFKITPLSTDVDKLLDDAEYSVVTPTNIMLMDISKLKSGKLTADVSVGIKGEWQKHFFNLTGQSGAVRTAQEIHKRIVSPALCATIAADSQIAACGLCVVDNGYAGLYDIHVAEHFRRRGFGRDICESLIVNAAKLGARTAYLQVVDSNENAKRLYEKLGFTFAYQYWYRVKKQ